MLALARLWILLVAILNVPQVNWWTVPPLLASAVQERMQAEQSESDCINFAQILLRFCITHDGPPPGPTCVLAEAMPL